MRHCTLAWPSFSWPVGAGGNVWICQAVIVMYHCTLAWLFFSLPGKGNREGSSRRELAVKRIAPAPVHPAALSSLSTLPALHLPAPSLHGTHSRPSAAQRSAHLPA